MIVWNENAELHEVFTSGIHELTHGGGWGGMKSFQPDMLVLSWRRRSLSVCFSPWPGQRQMKRLSRSQNLEIFVAYKQVLLFFPALLLSYFFLTRHVHVDVFILSQLCLQTMFPPSPMVGNRIKLFAPAYQRFHIPPVHLPFRLSKHPFFSPFFSLSAWCASLDLLVSAVPRLQQSGGVTKFTVMKLDTAGWLECE